ncbi:MAG: hypothetical protein JWR88_2014 [Pseudonocardia sp.]|nr:hypothetical protein [Pseudonocardia sp.]
MRGSSNPAFRNLPVGQQGGYATFDRNAGMAGGTAAYTDMQAAQADYGRAATAERPLTMDDVVTKTAVVAGVALVAGILTILAKAYYLAIPALIIGLIVALFVIFRQSTNPWLVLTYAAAEGVLLGAITGALELSGTQFQGIGLQAIIGTAGVFFGMLIVYRTGAVRVTPRFTKWLFGALIGVVVLMVANLLIGLFNGTGLGLRDGSPLAYVFSIVVIGVAAFSLLLDFDQADKAVKAGAPARFAWYIAFGLLVTLVWLYIEILQLLSYLRE